MFMGLLCMNQGGTSILYPQIWECRVPEHLGHSLKIPGWLSDLYAPVGPVLGSARSCKAWKWGLGQALHSSWVPGQDDRPEDSKGEGKDLRARKTLPSQRLQGSLGPGEGSF